MTAARSGATIRLLLAGCLLAGAIVSPPDPASMLIVAVPLTCVYCGAVVAWSRSRKRRVAEGDSASQEETE